MELTHDEMKARLRGLTGRQFVAELTQYAYDWSNKIPAEYYNYRIFEELTVRYETGEKTRKHLEKNKHYRLDAVIFIEPGRAALNQRSCYSVGLELKGNLKDLEGDKKLEQYVGWNDYFFIGCVSDIEAAACARAESDPYGRTGVFNVETGHVVKWPYRAHVPADHRLWMYEQVLFNTVFKDIKAISFKAEEVEVVPPDFTDREPSLGNLSNNDTLTNLSESDRIRMDEEKAARKAAAQARQEFRQRRAADMAERAQRMPEGVRLKLSAMPDGVQAAYHILCKNPGMTAIGLEESMNVGEATARRFVARLIEGGLIEHRGSKKFGGYHAIKFAPDLKYAPNCDACVHVFKPKNTKL